MADTTRRFPRAATLALTLGVVGLLSGCANVDGPSPTTTQMLGQNTYLVLGKFTSVSNTMKVLKRQMTQRADEQCPGGWTKLAEGPNPHAMDGGRIWQIRCTAPNSSNVAPAADSGTYVAPPATTAAATNRTGLLQLFTSAAMRAAPDLSRHAARAIARAQLHSLDAAGMRVTDAAGKPVPMR